MSPALLARFNREAEDAAQTIGELAYAAKRVTYYSNPDTKVEALATLVSAIQHQTSIILAVTRTVANEAEFDAARGQRP